MKKTCLILTLLLSSATFAEHHEHGHHKKSLSSHEHGSIKLEVAVDGKTIEVDIDGPAESFLGFEHAPVNTKDKKTFENAKALWEKDLLTKLFVLDKKLGCTSSEVKFEQELEEKGSHSDIEAKAKILCAQELKGESLSVAVKKHYPHIKKLTIDLVATTTKSINAKAVELLKL